MLVVSSRGEVVGAALGNDVNLRDIEGRSALLLPKAKDNNASAAIGPFLRLFDASYGIEDVRTAVVTLAVEGADGFSMVGQSPLSAIARDPLDIVSQVIGDHHQYPDGFVLFLGTLFAPVDDRDEPGRGFTHHIDDIVRIAEPRLGALTNRVRLSEQIEPWTFGIAALFDNLAKRSLLLMTLTTTDPRTGEARATDIEASTDADVAAVVAAAAAAFDDLRWTSRAWRAGLLEPLPRPSKSTVTSSWRSQTARPVSASRG